MFKRSRNGLGETPKQTLERRVEALEIHIQDTEARYAELENRFNLLRTQALDLHDKDTEVDDV